GSQGSSFFKADNPAFGATFTYYVKEAPKTLKDQRKEKEKEIIKKNEPVPYPSWEDLRKEDDELKPFLLFTITDEAGNIVRKLKSDVKEGINRITWDLKYPSSNPIRENSEEDNSSTPVLPGKYKVTMSLSIDGLLTDIAGPIEFEAKVLNNVTLPASDRKNLVEFQKKVAELNRAVRGAVELSKELKTKVEAIKSALRHTENAPQMLTENADRIAEENLNLYRKLTGDDVLEKRNEPVYPDISSRVGEIIYGLWQTSSDPTSTYEQNYQIASQEFKPVLEDLKRLSDVELKNLESEMEKLKAPWTPGRIPDWKE
ncbi:MAG TPA: glycosyl hydrolase, partial [Ignavibacteriaceae bacterium]